MRATSLIPPGLPATLTVPLVDVGSVLRGAARRYGDRIAFHHEGDELTFTQLLERASAIARGLQAAGVRDGEVVAVHMPNCLEYPPIYYGILMSGAVFGPTNPLLPPADLAFQLTDADAAAVITWGAAAAGLDAVREQIPARLIITVGTELDGAVTLEELTDGQSTEALPALPDGPDRLAHIAYTGGTTGRSKGVLLTHRHVVTNVLQSATWSSGSVPVLDDHGDLTLDQIGSTEEWRVRLGTSVSVSITPWFHAMGVIGYLSVPVMTGNTTVIHTRFDPGAYLADLERFHATGMGGAPAIFVALMRHPDWPTRDLSAIRSVSSGAAPLPVAVLEALRERCPDATISEGYGLTEVTMVAAGNPPWRSGLRKPGTVGIPGYNTEVMLVDPAGVEVADGERGEICIRGPQVMLGYHRRPDATAEVMLGDWFRSGDIGTIDEDGYISIVDRAKDMLIYKGYNVFPRELEELLHASPGVAAAAVVGRPDEDAGEVPVAFVVLAPDTDMTAEQIQSSINDNVVPYKRIREIHLVDNLPVSAAGKVLRRELRAMLGNA